MDYIHQTRVKKTLYMMFICLVKKIELVDVIKNELIFLLSPNDSPRAYTILEV